MKRNGVALCVATLAAAALPVSARAQAFGLNEIGTCAIGRGFAVTGAPCDDGSAIYWNPGAATNQADRLVLLVGAAAVDIGGQFEADVTGRVDKGDVPTEAPPHFFANWKATPRLAAGVGVYVPYGLTSQWRSDFPGRFAAQHASLGTVYVQPNVAYEVVPGRLSIGGGPVIGRSSVQLRQGIDAVSSDPRLGNAGVAPFTEIGMAKLDGSATAVGAHVGAFVRVLPTLTFGVRYLTALSFKYDDADATFFQTTTGIRIPRQPTQQDPSPFYLLDTTVARQFMAGGPLSRQKVSTHIKHPAQLQFGLGYSGFPGTTLSLDGAWVQWSSFKELPVDFKGGAPDRTLFEDYSDSWSVRAGAEHRFGIGVTGRAGFSFAQTPAPDETVTPLLPDMDRFNFNLGAGLPLGGRFALDAGYLRVETQGRRGRIVERTSRSQSAAQLNSGAYTLDANIFALSLRAQF
jgi:long-chain fatty acid transport protein